MLGMDVFKRPGFFFVILEVESVSTVFSVFHWQHIENQQDAIEQYVNDGGSVEYRALLYKITDYHQIAPVGSDYIEGIGIEILGIEVFNNAKEQTETLETTKERIKLEEVKFIDVEGTDTSKLVKFNNILYGKSYAVIDYAGDLNKNIGTILAGVTTFAAATLLCVGKLKGKIKGKLKIGKFNNPILNLAKSARKTFSSAFKKLKKVK